jgi:hypothetical protein
VLASSVAACARDPQPGTAEAAIEGERLMRRMSETLAAAPAFRFSTVESLEEAGPPAARRVFRFSRTVTVRRPDAVLFELHGTAGSPIDVAAYYDGHVVSLRDRRHGVWAQTDVPSTIDEMFDDVARRYSLPVPIADVVYSVPYDAFIGASTRGGLAGRETVDGVSCARLAFTDPHVDVTVWIPSRDEPLPRRVELVYKRAEGAPAARIDFTSWDLAPQLAEGTFAFQPNEDDERVPVERFVSMLLAGGHAPPAEGAIPAPPAGASAR